MASTVTPRQMSNIRLSAVFADFAYATGNPEETTEIDTAMQRGDLPQMLKPLTEQLPSYRVVAFQRFHSTFHVNRREDQHRWFRSTSYFCQMSKEGDDDKIFIGFRGTWLHPGGVRGAGKGQQGTHLHAPVRTQ